MDSFHKNCTNKLKDSFKSYAIVTKIIPTIAKTTPILFFVLKLSLNKSKPTIVETTTTPTPTAVLFATDVLPIFHATVGATGQDGTLSYIADGWGTLQLPGGTYDVIRVKTEVNKSDTLYLSLLSFGFRFPSNEVVYEWYAIGEGFPVLTVTESAFGLISTVTYSDDLINGIEDFKTPTANKIYPNPVTDKLIVKTTRQGALKIIIYDVQGREVKRVLSKNKKTKVNTKSLSPGMYFVLIESNSLPYTHKVIKE